MMYMYIIARPITREGEGEDTPLPLLKMSFLLNFAKKRCKWGIKSQKIQIFVTK